MHDVIHARFTSKKVKKSLCLLYVLKVRLPDEIQRNPSSKWTLHLHVWFGKHIPEFIQSESLVHTSEIFLKINSMSSGY